MRSNCKHSVEELEQYIHRYLEEGLSYQELCQTYGLKLSHSLFREKVLKYQNHGRQGIQSRVKNNHYSREFKLTVVNEYFVEGLSIHELTRKYNIASRSTVRNWLIKYTRGEAIETYSPKPEVYTMKSRKTSHAEKIEIVRDCLTNNLSYKETAEKYQVSYPNVYSWTQKYRKHGPDGLFDGRGRGKPKTIQTEAEKMRAKYAVLKARNEYLETENAALKKLKEVERELMLREHSMKQIFKRSKNSNKKDTE